jgi:predicted extracellular nuclease
MTSVQASAETSQLAGQQVTIHEELTVADLWSAGRGDVLMSFGGRMWQPTEVEDPGASAQYVMQQNKCREFWVRLPAPVSGLRVGDTVASLTGILDQSRSDRLLVDHMPQFASRNPRPQPPAAPGDDLRIVAFNLLNFFNGDGQGGQFPTARGASDARELERQKVKLVAAMKALDAHVFALSELENDGFGPHSAVAELVGALRLATGRNYQVATVNEERVGSDQISVGLLFDADRLTALGSALTTHKPPLGVRSRAPLAQTFQDDQGHTITIVVVHMKSKGCGVAAGVDASQGDGQGCWNTSRTTANRVLLNWIADFGDLDNTLIIGDFNAQTREDPIIAMVDAGLTRLSESSDQEYSYVYAGRAGTLDHAFAGSALAGLVSKVQHWHINADEAQSLDYNLEGGGDDYQPDAFRSSDHDPLLVDLSWPEVH